MGCVWYWWCSLLSAMCAKRERKVWTVAPFQPGKVWVLKDTSARKAQVFPWGGSGSWGNSGQNSLDHFGQRNFIRYGDVWVIIMRENQAWSHYLTPHLAWKVCVIVSNSTAWFILRLRTWQLWPFCKKTMAPFAARHPLPPLHPPSSVSKRHVMW